MTLQRRHLVIVRAGDASLHPRWIAAPGRDFDLFVSHYGADPARWRDDGADFHEHRPGPKWPALHALLQERPELIERYDAVWLPDDDLDCDAATIDRLFAFFRAFELQLAQPALTRDSFHTWRTLLQDRRSVLRTTGFVEVMAPLFSRTALRLCWHTFAESRSGWGLDWVWPSICRRAGLRGIAIVDAAPVRHTRPVGGELYRNHPTMDPRADARAVLARHGLTALRAAANHSIEARVQWRPLPWWQRALQALRRWNGRRLERRRAAHPDAATDGRNDGAGRAGHEGRDGHDEQPLAAK